MVEDLSEQAWYYLPATHCMGMGYYGPVPGGISCGPKQQVWALRVGWIRGKLRVIIATNVSSRDLLCKAKRCSTFLRPKGKQEIDGHSVF